MLKNEGNVLQFVPPNSRRTRGKKHNFNYFKALFCASLGFNIILFIAILIR